MNPNKSMSKSAGFHETFDRDTPVPQSTDRGFGLVFAGAFAVLAALSLYRGHMQSAIALAGASAVFLILALTCAAVLAPLNRLWFRFGLLLNRIINPLVMGLVFFTCVVPIGLVMRLLGKDPLRLRFDPAARSYWIVRTPPGPPPQDMKNQF